MEGPIVVLILIFIAGLPFGLSINYNGKWGKCFEGELYPVDQRGQWIGFSCYDKQGNEYKTDQIILSCCGCIKLTCNISQSSSGSYREFKSFWNISKENTCCQDCHGKVYPIGAVISSQTLNDKCSTTVTKRCVAGSQGNKSVAIIYDSFEFKSCCADSTGLLPIGNITLDQKTCSTRSCKLKMGNLHASWDSSIKECPGSGCDCCVYDGQLVCDGGHVTLKDGVNATCCEGQLLVLTPPDTTTTIPATTTTATITTATTTPKICETDLDCDSLHAQKCINKICSPPIGKVVIRSLTMTSINCTGCNPTDKKGAKIVMKGVSLYQCTIENLGSASHYFANETNKFSSAQDLGSSQVGGCYLGDMHGDDLTSCIVTWNGQGEWTPGNFSIKFLHYDDRRVDCINEQRVTLQSGASYSFKCNLIIYYDKVVIRSLTMTSINCIGCNPTDKTGAKIVMIGVPPYQCTIENLGKASHYFAKETNTYSSAQDLGPTQVGGCYLGDMHGNDLTSFTVTWNGQGEWTPGNFTIKFILKKYIHIMDHRRMRKGDNKILRRVDCINEQRVTLQNGASYSFKCNSYP